MRYSESSLSIRHSQAFLGDCNIFFGGFDRHLHGLGLSCLLYNILGTSGHRFKQERGLVANIKICVQIL